MSYSEKISNILGEIIANADDTLQQKLSQALEDFAEQHNRSFKSVQNTPWSRSLMEAMVEASDARIEL